MNKLLLRVSISIIGMVFVFALVNADLSLVFARSFLGIQSTTQWDISDSTRVISQRIVIPSIGVDAPYIYAEKVDEKHFQELLQSGVVHYPSTAMPGQVGNSYFFGHSSDAVWNPGDYKTVFALLPQASIGDKVFVYDKDGQSYEYVIYEKFIASKRDIGLLGQDFGGGRVITIQTSYPIGTALKRFILRGKMP